jgi:integrase
MATVQKRGNAYTIKVSCGYDINGKQIIKSTTWKPETGLTPKQTEKELERQKFLFEERVKNGHCLDGNIKFAEFTDKWLLDYAEKQLAPKTLARYKELLKRIIPAIGHIHLDKIQPHHLLALYSNLAEPGINIKTGQGLSSKTILHHHRLISSIMNTAVQWQVILSNPAERAKPPKVMRSEAKYLDEVQSQKVIELLANEPIQYRTMITLFIYSGLRRGELCGLEWKDVDFKNHLINVARASQYLPGKGIFEKETKNISSERTISLAPLVFDNLREFKGWQLQERVKLGDQWVESDRLFTQWNGNPIHPDTITSWFADFIKKNDLPHVSIHSLRHTNATLLIAGGTDIRTVSKRLGHAQTSTTGNIYAHAIRSADEATSGTLETLLNPINKKLTDKHA